MPISPCPHCGTDLEIESRFIGQTIRCSHCNGQFTAEEPQQNEETDNSTFVAILGGIAAFHAAGFLILALWQGFGLAFFMLVGVLVLELVVWKRNEILGFVEATISSAMTSQDEDYIEPILDVSHQTPRPERKGNSQPSRRTSARPNDDDLVEVIPQGRTSSGSPIPSPTRERSHPSSRPPSSNRPYPPTPAVRPEPASRQANCRFLGAGTEVDFGRGAIRNPLVYTSDVGCHGEFDSSLIDTTLVVARSGTPVRDSLPYWPSYYHCTPAQRSIYLDWLSTGKADPNVELGYVFIYFYGLERRVLIDRADFYLVAEEMIRFLPIYGYSNSFRRYASGLLWLSLLLGSESEQLPEDLLAKAIAETPRWNDELVERYLAILFNAKRPLPVDAAFHVCQNDARSASSVIVRRHEDEFKALFGTRYREKYGEGVELRASKREKRVPYHPASSSLMRGYGDTSNVELPKMPDVLAISSQFKGLTEIWNESIEHLKAFSRAARNAGGEVTAEAYEALPNELRKGDHPEMDAWMQAWEDHVDEEHRPLVPVGALAKIKGLPERERLTKAQCMKIVQSADAMGLAIEPDVRMTGTNYRWDEKVILFFQEDDSTDQRKYMAASALLRLGTTIAEADGTIDDVELEYISNHLEGQFNLSDFDSKRLECLQYLLLHSQAGDNKVGKTLAKRLSREHRLVVGEYLVGIAAADEVITSDEVKALRKAYKLLELESKDLDVLIAKHEASKTDSSAVGTDAEGELRLDHSEISRILSETRAVAGILEEAMSEVDEEDEADIEEELEMPEEHSQPGAAVTSDESSSHDDPEDDIDIDARYKPFLLAALNQAEWDLGDLRALADTHKVMLAGAIEAINEWSMDRYGDWIIEEGDPIQIRHDLLEEKI